MYSILLIALIERHEACGMYGFIYCMYDYELSRESVIFSDEYIWFLKALVGVTPSRLLTGGTASRAARLVITASCPTIRAGLVALERTPRLLLAFERLFAILTAVGKVTP